MSAIGRAVAHHNPGSEGDEITALCDEAKKYLAQRTWIIKNPDVSLLKIFRALSQI